MVADLEARLAGEPVGGGDVFKKVVACSFYSFGGGDDVLGRDRDGELPAVVLHALREGAQGGYGGVAGNCLFDRF